MDFEKEKLTKNQLTVLNLLENAKEPVKAYNILFDIQKKGINAPTQVYRALDKLIEVGKVHKIESQNSYIACNNKSCGSKTSTTFLICEECNNVVELEKDKASSSYFEKISKKFGFKYSEHNLEIFGQCEFCK